MTKIENAKDNILNFFHLSISNIIRNAEIIKFKNATLSPDKKIKISIKINRRNVKYRFKV